MIVILAGFLSGIISGMGIGGGMILIPALTFFEGTSQHVAQTVNLFYFVPTAIAALIVHIKHKNVEIKSAMKIVAAGLLFAALGAWLASVTGDELLRKAFGGFIILFGIREIYIGFKEKSLKLRKMR